MTITEVIETIKAFYQGDPAITEETTRDQVLYGETDGDCTGVVTCIWPSVQILEEAHLLGANLIICHEALFWNHGDHQDRGCSEATKERMIKILDFMQFFKHFVFVPDDLGGLKKVQKKEIEVSVFISPAHCQVKCNTFDTELEFLCLGCLG